MRSKHGIGFAALIATVGCASAEPPRAPEPHPPPTAVAIELAAVADEGCACPNEACLEDAHRRFAALEAKHGGIDEIPADAYPAHARFERCYLDGTKDPARDVELATRKLCSCSEGSCVDAAMSEISSLQDKYRGAALSAHDAESLRRSDSELEGCLKEKIGDGLAVAATTETIANTICACTSPGCVQAAWRRWGPEASRFLLIRHQDDSAARIQRAEEKMCGCGVGALLQTLVPKGIAIKAQVDCRIVKAAPARTFPKR